MSTDRTTGYKASNYETESGYGAVGLLEAPSELEKLAGDQPKNEQPMSETVRELREKAYVKPEEYTQPKGE